MKTIAQAAADHGVTRQRMLALVNQGRVPGAQKDAAGRWMLPARYKITPPPQRKRAPDKIKTRA